MLLDVHTGFAGDWHTGLAFQTTQHRMGKTRELFKKIRDTKGKNEIRPQGKKNPNEMEISNSPNKEFKAMVIKMITELRKEWRSIVRISTKN